MNKERDSLEEAFFLVNPINPPDFTTKTILGNGQEMEVTGCTGEFVGDEPERFNLAMDRAVLARKSEATKAKKVSVLPAARAKRTGESRERDQEVFVAARSILAPLKQCITMNSLAQKVAEHLGEGWTRKSAAPRLKRVCGGLSQNKIQSSQNRSRD